MELTRQARLTMYLFLAAIGIAMLAPIDFPKHYVGIISGAFAARWLINSFIDHSKPALFSVSFGVTLAFMIGFASNPASNISDLDLLLLTMSAMFGSFFVDFINKICRTNTTQTEPGSTSA